jgi:mRNA interferase RelE/StbE
MTGGRSSYRLREGMYRVIYTVSGELLLIEIIKVGHRKDVYK